MKKYRVTKKHPYYKTGIEVNDSDGYLYLIRDNISTTEKIKNALNDNWIEEIQEPKFTRNDLMLFLEWYIASDEYINKNVVDNWIKKTRR